MLHDHDDKHENADEPEYHFSGDEEGEALDVEPPKATSSLSTESKPAGGAKRFAPSRRMILSLVIFLVLVFVVYKMVVPATQTAPSGEIAAPSIPVAPVNAKAPNPAQAPVASQQQAIQNMPQPANATSPAMSPTQNMQQMTSPASAMSPSAPIQEGVPPAVAQPNTAAPQPTSQSEQPMMGTSALTVVPGAAPPVTNNMVATEMTQQAAPSEGSVAVPLSSNEAKMIELEAESARLLNQMNTEYTQKLNDFSVQNKALQDQMQALNSRVMSMETQLNQLVQTLTRQTQQQNNAAPAPAGSEDQSSSAVEPKIAYTVQAIIPGRAWLKSDNGDIVTVAEGDTIKNVGRVTKIDPYDGIVEVNVGNKTVSLSYGTGT